MPEKKRFSLVKPDLQTPFHIDFEWWQQHDNNWRVFLQSCLCAEHQEQYSATEDESIVDFVDPQTAEVKQIDWIQHILMTHCALQQGFITTNTTLVDAVFRFLLSTGNNPKNALELSEHIGKPAEMILRTLTGGTVYRGLKPLTH